MIIMGTDRSAANREAWLNAGIEVFRPRFVEVGYPLPERVRVSVGWGSRGARQENAKILGVTYDRRCSGDDTHEIFVTPEDADTASMLETLLHELVHVATDCGNNVEDNGKAHGPRFAEIATRLGFNGPMTSTPPSVELAAELITIASALGPYPGSVITLPERVPAGMPVPAGGGAITPGGIRWTSGPGTQGTRMIRLICTSKHTDPALDGYQVRTTRKWIERGLPRCPDGHTLKPDA